jgi:hypothetical protein
MQATTANAGAPIAAVDKNSFKQFVSDYARQLNSLLTGGFWTPWRSAFWTHGHWARRDAELQKILARTYGLLHDILRLDEPGGGRPRIAEATQQRIRYLLQDDAPALTLDAAIERFDALDRLVIEIGDARYVCSKIEGDRQWKKGSTTWLTWEAIYGPGTPAALETYRRGAKVPDDQLAAAQNQLLGFRRARADDYQVHRARQKMRAANLRYLALLLLPLVGLLGWLLARTRAGGLSLEGVGLIASIGALGAVVMGTLRARDRLVRGSDLRTFRAGLLAQVLVGAASAIVVMLVLASGIAHIAGAASLEGKAVVGFVAGFSEPFFLRTIERVAKLGEESAPERETSAAGTSPAGGVRQTAPGAPQPAT